MSVWSWLRRALGRIASASTEPRVIEDVGAVVVDVTRVVASGVSPAGALAGLRTAKDLGKLVGEVQGDGTVPMPLSAKDVARQRAQAVSAARPPPKKPPTPGRK
jgi:hypothetical protein